MQFSIRTHSESFILEFQNYQSSIGHRFSPANNTLKFAYSPHSQSPVPDHRKIENLEKGRNL
jgi:hypothetical protein